MMPRWLAVLFLVGLGAVVLVYAYRARQAGEVRAGLSGGRPYTPNRTDNPIAFGFFVTAYFLCGVALCAWGVLVLMGLAAAPHWQ